MSSAESMTIQGKGGMTAKVVCDSLHPSPDGKRLITTQIKNIRFTHAEFMTHRVFSRNASSSRAIPVAKMIEQVRNNPAMPIHWGANQTGMQASKELEGQKLEDVKLAWLRAANQAADIAEVMMNADTHKQVANRILEPFQFISVIVTATEWDNFFELRDHPDAQPEIQELARIMKLAISCSTSQQLSYGDWHLPYVKKRELVEYGLNVCRKISAARCARVSYLTHDGQTPDVTKDIELFEKLVGGAPLHASPIEHQATPENFDVLNNWPNEAASNLCGNLHHWVQFRKLHENTIYAKDLAT